MAKARRVTLETWIFEKDGDAITYFSSMLGKYLVGACI